MFVAAFQRSRLCSDVQQLATNNGRHTDQLIMIARRQCPCLCCQFCSHHRSNATASLINNWHTRQIDFALAHPQAKVSHDVFMLPPDKFDVQDGKLQLNQTAKPPWKQQHRLKLLQNLHGLKDAGATWFNHLRKGLVEDLKFKQSLVDPCLFYRGQVILVICVDDCLVFTPKKSEADNLIHSRSNP